MKIDHLHTVNGHDVDEKQLKMRKQQKSNLQLKWKEMNKKKFVIGRIQKRIQMDDDGRHRTHIMTTYLCIFFHSPSGLNMYTIYLTKYKKRKLNIHEERK